MIVVGLNSLDVAFQLFQSIFDHWNVFCSYKGWQKDHLGYSLFLALTIIVRIYNQVNLISKSLKKQKWNSKQIFSPFNLTMIKSFKSKQTMIINKLCLSQANQQSLKVLFFLLLIDKQLQQSLMSQARTLVWINDTNDKKLNLIKQALYRGLQQQSKSVISYYDFLLVAKKLNFRFEESSHLMELRKYFFDHKNQVSNKRLTNLLCVEQETLMFMHGDRLPQKIIIRFKVDAEIEMIKQVTNEDEQIADSDDQHIKPYGKSANVNIQSKNFTSDDGEQFREKLTIILSIKVTEMVKKIKILMEGIHTFEENDQAVVNLESVFKGMSLNKIPFEIFRRGTVNLIKKLQNEFSKQKLTMSEIDIRAVFTILDEGEKGEIQVQKLQLLRDEIRTVRMITRFYQSRINKKMVKNTLFKLAKNSNNIQLYQVKNASLLQFKNMEEGLLESTKSRDKVKSNRVPHFGPIKGSGLRSSHSKSILQKQTNRQNHSSLAVYKNITGQNLQKQREKIERIIRSSKSDKKSLEHDTIANKLRKLFIHKVILPRQKLLEEQKLKYTQNKSVSSNMIVKLM